MKKRMPEFSKKRSDYKGTWDELARQHDDAKNSVAGTTDEKAFDELGEYSVDLLEEQIDIKPTDIVLEIGCGVGRVGKVLSGKCAKWIGTDISANMLQHAAKRLEGLNNIELIELGTVGLREIPDSSVDVVYCTVVFMHLFEWDRYKYVKDSYRVLKPGGRCYYDNVDIASKYGKAIFMESMSCEIDKRPAALSMVSSKEELYTYARWAGFEDIKVHTFADTWISISAIKK